MKSSFQVKISNEFMKFIRDNPDIPWEWEKITMNPIITWEIVRDNPHYPWRWFYVSIL